MKIAEKIKNLRFAFGEMTYGEAAKLFGVSRNAVAGVVKRWRDAKEAPPAPEERAQEDRRA